MHVMRLNKTIPFKYFNMRLTFKPWGIPQPWSINFLGPFWTCLPIGAIALSQPDICHPHLALSVLGPSWTQTRFLEQCPRHISRGTLQSINYCWCANTSHHLRWFVDIWVKNVPIKSLGSFFAFLVGEFQGETLKVPLRFLQQIKLFHMHIFNFLKKFLKPF